MSSTVETDTAIRSFHVEIPEDDLADLRRRLAATGWPERETVADATQGVQLETMQALVRYRGAAAWQEPELFTSELRATFSSLRR
jgi:hypothetical protein